MTISRATVRRLCALGLAGGFVTMAFDAAVSHFADKPMTDPFQRVPIFASQLAVLACLAFAAAPRPGPVLRWVMRLAGGAASVLVGIAGTVFHGLALAFNLKGVEWTSEDLQAAFALSPPTFAPGGFVLLGVGCWLVATERWVVVAAPAVPSPDPVAQVRPSGA